MKTFLQLSKRAFQRQMSYRAATFAGLATNFFWGILRAALMIALFDPGQIVGGYDLQAAITYTGLTQASIGYLNAFGWYDLIRSVYTGDVASDLLKPMDYYNYWLAQDAGRAVSSFFMRGLTLMFSYALFVGIDYPETFQHWLLVFSAIILSWLVSFSWRFVVNLSAFWFPNAINVGRMLFFNSLFFSGFLMPLRFLPDWVNKIAYLTPFPHMINTLVEIYLGVVTGPGAITALIWQAIWIGILWLAGQLLLRAGVRRLVIQGG